MLPLRVHTAILLALLSSAAACRQPEPSSHESLTARAEPLRTAFNRDVGKVRILMIVAPT